MTIPTAEFIFPDNSKRSLIKVSEVPEGFLPEVLIVDGDKLEKKVINLGVDLGAVGDVLEGEGIIQELGIPEEDGVWNMEKAVLMATIISEEQQVKLGIDTEVGTRIGVIENREKNKRVFFRLTDLDVAEKFCKKIESGEELELEIKKFEGGDYVLPTDPKNLLEVSRSIYGVWDYALKSGNPKMVDEVMEKIYKDILPKKEISLDGIKENLKTFLKEEDSKPAENWWRAREATNKIIDLLKKENGLDQSFEEVLKTIDLVAEKQFGPEMLWKFIVQPIMEEFCDDKRKDARYEKKAFLARLLGDQEYTIASFKLKQAKEVLDILGEKVD